MKTLFTSALLVAVAACSGSSSSGGAGGGSGSTGGSSGTGGSSATGGGSSTGGSSGGGSATGGSGGSGGGADAGTGGTGGTGGGTVTCHYSASGAQDGGGSCTVQAAFDRDTPGIGITLYDNPQLPQFSFGGEIPGAMTLTNGTYTLSDMPEAGGTWGIGWAMCNNNNCTDGMSNMIPNQGTFSLTVTATGPNSFDAGLWTGSHGNGTFHYPFVPNTTGSSGTVDISVTW